jgi:hypothetical protein
MLSQCQHISYIWGVHSSSHSKSTDVPDWCFLFLQSNCWNSNMTISFPIVAISPCMSIFFLFLIGHCHWYSIVKEHDYDDDDNDDNVECLTVDERSWQRMKCMYYVKKTGKIIGLAANRCGNSGQKKSENYKNFQNNSCVAMLCKIFYQSC